MKRLAVLCILALPLAACGSSDGVAATAKEGDAFCKLAQTAKDDNDALDTIDVTAVSTDALGLNHSGYAENPALLDDVKALVEFGIRPPDKRIKNVLTVQTDTGIFWRFTTAK